MKENQKEDKISQKGSKKILITGAGGFIGSFLVEEALQRGWQTWAGIRKSSSKEYLQDKKIEFIDLNYAHKDELKKQLAEHAAQYGKWDYVVHNMGVTKCLHSEDFHRVNYGYTKNLIEALEESATIPEKFILMSSLSAHHPKANTAYGNSKLKAEQFLEFRNDFPYIILCPTGVYGPREKDYYLMLKTIRAGLDIAAGLKPQKLSFLYVKDLVKAVYMALDSPVERKSYAVADGRTYSDSEYTNLAKKALGKKLVLKLRVPLVVLKTISHISEAISKLTRKPATLNRDKYQIMKQRDWSCNTAPIEEDLHFHADYDLEKGLQESVEWYRKNKWL